MKFRFLENVAIADIAFEAYGKTFDEAIENAGTALTEVMADPKKLASTEKKKIAVYGKTEQDLLYNFLEELVYIKDVDGILFKKFNSKISQGKLEVFCKGGKIKGAQGLRNDVKAITMHMFGIKNEKGKIIATVVVDI